MSTLISRIKRHRSGEILTPLVDEFYRRASMNGGVTYSSRTMEILRTLALRPQRDRTSSFSASNLGSCMRAQVLLYNNEDQDIYPDERREAIFWNGHWLHLKWGGIFLEMGIVRGMSNPLPDLELPVHIPEWGVRGTLDCIAILEDEWIVDVKGVGHHYWSMMKGGDIPRTYLWQQQAYMRATGIEKAMLFLENKATGEYMEIHMPPPDSLVAMQMEARVRALNHYVDNRELPPPLIGFPTADECRECPFRDICKDAQFRPQRSIEV